METAALCLTPLFRGTSPQETEEMLACLGAERRSFAKGERIYRAGDTVTALGVVLQGSVLIESSDLWGNTSVLDSVGPGQIFAETYACCPGEPLMVDVTAAEAAEVLFLRMERILQVCPNSCPHHSRLIRNLLTLSSQKNLTLSRKIFYTSPKTIRGRLLSYLSSQALRSGSRSFTIPFNRQQLADYLSVNRSAMSQELCQLRDEGRIRFRRNHFALLRPPISLSGRP